MQQKIQLRLLPAEAVSDTDIKRAIAATTGKKLTHITGYHLLKKSLDARAKTIWVNLTVHAFIDEPFQDRSLQPFIFKDVAHSARKVVIIGAGPAGLFAALELIEKGIQPIILERGKNRFRRDDEADPVF